jgi:hypothetical protein
MILKIISPIKIGGKMPFMQKKTGHNIGFEENRQLFQKLLRMLIMT